MLLHCRPALAPDIGPGGQGLPGARLKLSWRFITDRVVRTHAVIVSTPSLPFLTRLVETEEPLGVSHACFGDLLDPL
jgi:hypothetical protein